MKVPEHLLYTRTHEWISIEDGLATVGITGFAAQQLDDVAYVELPAAGDRFMPGDEAAVVESVKAASDIYVPVAGAVEEVNGELHDHPELVSQDPYGEGWLFKIRLAVEDDHDGLLSEEEYRKLIPNAGQETFDDGSGPVF